MQTDNNDHWFLNGKKVVCNYLDHHTSSNNKCLANPITKSSMESQSL